MQGRTVITKLVGEKTMYEHITEAEARKQILDLVADYCDTFHKKKAY